MRKQKYYDIGPITGKGQAITTAKEDALAQAAEALGDISYPYMRRFPNGDIGLVYRAPYGWNYQIMRQEEQTNHPHSCLVGCGGNKRDAIHALERHMAQNCMDMPDRGMACLTHEEDRREHARYIIWQDAYAQAARRGLDDPACRAYADTQRSHAV